MSDAGTLYELCITAPIRPVAWYGQHPLYLGASLALLALLVLPLAACAYQPLDDEDYCTGWG